MAVVDGGTLVGRILGEQKVKYLFSINGGHLFPILANLKNNNIKLIHMRHEQAAAYAADGRARSTGTPGVCCVTAGCGLTNAVTGLCVAGLTNSSVVCLSGQHPFGEIASALEEFFAGIRSRGNALVEHAIAVFVFHERIESALARLAPDRQ